MVIKETALKSGHWLVETNFPRNMFKKLVHHDDVGASENEVNILPPCGRLLANHSFSRQVKTTTILHHDWDDHFDCGHLVAVHRDKLADVIIPEVILHIQVDEFTLLGPYGLVWFFYVQNGDSDYNVHDPAKMLAIWNRTEVQVWNVEMVRQITKRQPVSHKTVKDGVMRIKQSDAMMLVSCAAFVPDGSAIAIAYQSGLVQIFLVDLEEESTEPVCVHEWQPHERESLTSLYFLNDHTNQASELPVWRFALTGAKNNTELKLWSLDSWKCIQTLRINNSQNQPSVHLRLKGELDLTSKYFVLTDLSTMILMTFEIDQDHKSRKAQLVLLSQCYLTQPCLSLTIYGVDMHHQKGQHTGQKSKDKAWVGMKMYGVHTKSLRKLLACLPSSRSLGLHTSTLRTAIHDENEFFKEVPMAFTWSNPVFVAPQALTARNDLNKTKAMETAIASMQSVLHSSSDLIKATAMETATVSMPSVSQTVDESLMLIANNETNKHLKRKDRSTHLLQPNRKKRKNQIIHKNKHQGHLGSGDILKQEESLMLRLHHSNMENTPESTCPKVTTLAMMNRIIFCDIENINFFKYATGSLLPKTFVWLFLGKRSKVDNFLLKNVYQKPLYLELVKLQCVHISTEIGISKDAADFAICLTVAKLDERLVKSINFYVVSEDKGFVELEKQMRCSGRKVIRLAPKRKDQIDCSFFL